MIFIAVCAVAVIAIGVLAIRLLRGGFPPDRRDVIYPRGAFPRPWRAVYSVACFVVLIVIMLNSTADAAIRALVIGIGAVVCIGQFIALEAIYGENDRS